jgi:hypothetical protein
MFRSLKKSVRIRRGDVRPGFAGLAMGRAAAFTQATKGRSRISQTPGKIGQVSTKSKTDRKSKKRVRRDPQKGSTWGGRSLR